MAFTDDEAVWVVLEYGSLKSVTAIRRKFGRHFKKKHAVPSIMTFKRLVDRFQKTGNTSTAKPEDRSATPGELVEKVRQLVKLFRP